MGGKPYSKNCLVGANKRALNSGSATKSVVLSKLLNLSGPQFPYLLNRVKSTNLIGLDEGEIR